MTRFNEPTKNPRKTTNFESAPAFKISPEYELYSLIVTSSFSDTFYESNDARLIRLRRLITKCDPMFVAKLAVYAREQMYLRTMPIVLTIELTKHLHDTKTVKKNIITKMTERVIQRADEITEMLAYYSKVNFLNVSEKNSKPKKLAKMSNALKTGIANSFHKFNEYQFAKYNRDTEIKLRDALFLTHPRPGSEEEKELFSKIASNTLKTPDTWEVALSTTKNKSKTEIWSDVINKNMLGYMAMLRNLRNILQAKVSNNQIIKIADFLRNPTQVQKSKQFPFRFLSAYKELIVLEVDFDKSQVKMLTDALEDAIVLSVEHLKGFDLKQSIMIACDVSGSMSVGISDKSKVMRYDIGLVLGMLLHHKCKNVTSGIFGDSFETVVLPKHNVLDNVTKLDKLRNKVGFSTNGHEVINYLLLNNKSVDKIMMFTDCQMWDSHGTGQYMSKSWHKYKGLNPKCKLYLFDLSGHGTTPVDMIEQDVFLIAGWSDKVFDVLDGLEQGVTALDKINQINL